MVPYQMIGQMIGNGEQQGGQVLGGIVDLLGSQKAQEAQMEAQRQAKSDINQGYGEAKGFQNPIYNTGLGNYTNLSQRYGAGGFNNPAMNFDPNQVFQDPEYKAQMASGMNAINSGAERNGNLFSTVNQKDLNQFGQNTFAVRSDALFGRAKDIWQQGTQNNLNQYNEGMGLARPGFGAADQLSNLAAGQGQTLADLSLGQGDIRSGGIMHQTNALGALGADIFNTTGRGKGGMGASNFGGMGDMGGLGKK